MNEPSRAACAGDLSKKGADGGGEFRRYFVESVFGDSVQYESAADELQHQCI